MRYLRWYYFWLGEIGLASILAGIFAVPFGILLLGRAEIALAFIGSAVHVLPKLI